MTFQNEKTSIVSILKHVCLQGIDINSHVEIDGISKHIDRGEVTVIGNQRSQMSKSFATLMDSLLKLSVDE